MTRENLQNHYREVLAETLNQMQSLTLLIAQIENKMDEVRDSMHNLNQIMEQIINSNPAD